MQKQKTALTILNNYNFLVLLCLLFYIPFVGIAQNKSESLEIDSLVQLEYNVLFKKFKENNKDSIIANRFLKAYAKKAKINKDTLKIIRSLINTSIYINTISVKLKYLDSVLSISNEYKYRSDYIQANFLKGISYYSQNENNKALSYLLKVKKLNKKYENDQEFNLNVDNTIALIKNRLGKYKESLSIFKKAYNYYYSIEDSKIYASYMLNPIVDAYINLGEIDSASYYNNILLKTIDSPSDDNYPYYLISESAILLKKKDYNKSIDTTKKAIVYLKKVGDQYNLQFAYYYLGKNYMALNKKQEGLHYLLQLDSVYMREKDLFPNNRNGYELLINHFKEINDKENELVYVKKLLSIDSTLTKNYKVLSQKIFKEYDTPKLLSDKQKIIDEINQEKNTSNNFLKISSIILILLALVTFYFFDQNRKNKKRFEALVSETESNTIAITKNNTIKENDIEISQEIVEQILKKIAIFENKQTYLEPDLTLNELANHFDTNSKYLSKIINHYKNKRFTNYLNDLRVNHAIKKLKTDNSFKKYTIRAIAKEVGFNSTDSFTRAFYKKTGLKVSYFLKELEK